MNANLITATAHASVTGYCVYSAAEAAAKLGVSETTVRRAVRKLGVKKITGKTVAGFVSWPRRHGNMDVRLPYSA